LAVEWCLLQQEDLAAVAATAATDRATEAMVCLDEKAPTEDDDDDDDGELSSSELSSKWFESGSGVGGAQQRPEQGSEESW
jgi:hypothetical protein